MKVGITPLLKGAVQGAQRNGFNRWENKKEQRSGRLNPCEGKTLMEG